MAILIDFSQICLVNLYSKLNDTSAFYTDATSDRDKAKSIFRQLILSSLIQYNKMFRISYGDMVISCDGLSYWRRDVFPQYKSTRKKQREQAGIDWKFVFSCIDELIEDLRNNFPYKVVRVDSAESDDVIATLTKKFVSEKEDVLIVSSDKDFVQLHSPLVDQYSPQQRKFVIEMNPQKYLKEKIIKGDRGDGIPNILTDDNVFEEGRKQNMISSKRLNEFLSHDLTKYYDSDVKNRYMRNRMLIDFNYIPDVIRQSILDEYDKPVQGSIGKVFDYLIKHRYGLLVEDIKNF